MTVHHNNSHINDAKDDNNMNGKNDLSDIFTESCIPRDDNVRENWSKRNFIKKSEELSVFAFVLVLCVATIMVSVSPIADWEYCDEISTQCNVTNNQGVISWKPMTFGNNKTTGRLFPCAFPNQNVSFTGWYIVPCVYDSRMECPRMKCNEYHSILPGKHFNSMVVGIPIGVILYKLFMSILTGYFI